MIRRLREPARPSIHPEPELLDEALAPSRSKGRHPVATTLERVAAFRNEQIRNFSDSADRASLEAALARARSAFGRQYPLLIGGQRVETEKKIESRNPARPAEIVGTLASPPLDQANT